jgi:hypothetical protein
MGKYFWGILILIFGVRYLTTLPVYKDGDNLRITAKVIEEPIRFSYKQRVIFWV